MYSFIINIMLKNICVKREKTEKQMSPNADKQ